MWRLANTFRLSIFQPFSASTQYGMIFTKVWYFDKKEDCNEIEHMCNTFISQGVKIYFVELEADVEERLIRNKTIHRLEHKPTKRDIDQSEQHLLSSLKTNRTTKIYIELKVEETGNGLPIRLTVRRLTNGQFIYTLNSALYKTSDSALTQQTMLLW